MSERANVIKEAIEHQDNLFLAVYVETKNSIMIMLSEKEDKLGTLAVAIPKPRDNSVGSASSSVLLGDKNVISARMFAEYTAAKKNKTALVSVYLQNISESQAQEIFMYLIDKVLKTDSSQKEPTALY